jgi:hypothetical protein
MNLPPAPKGLIFLLNAELGILFLNRRILQILKAVRNLRFTVLLYV